MSQFLKFTVCFILCAQGYFISIILKYDGQKYYEPHPVVKISEKLPEVLMYMT